MEKGLEHYVSLLEDNLTISEQCETRLKKKKKNNLEPIPIDLIIEILSRLPAKSIARCRCISKLWASTLRLPCFTELYLTRSSTRPQLFFSCYDTGELLLFSAPQVQNQSVVTASYHMKFPFEDATDSFSAFRGLISLTNVRFLKGIYNPSTRESLNIPSVKTRDSSVRSFLGYDPIDKQYKVLFNMTWNPYGRHGVPHEHLVLTLGTTTNHWRRIECSVPHYASRIARMVCINGGLYYHANAYAYSGEAKIVWFDVRSEKFRFINNVAEDTSWHPDSTLVNYKGKLGVLVPDSFDVYKVVSGESRCFKLWVLVDAEKHEWSKHVYVLPSLWKNVVGAEAKLFFVGVIAGTDEVVLAPECHESDCFYIYYYNLEKETIRRVEIQGMDAVKDHKVETFLDHLEDVKLLQMT